MAHKMAQYTKTRHNRAIRTRVWIPMATDIAALLASIDASPRPLALADLLVRHPELPRRTAQRWLSRLLAEGAIRAVGEGRGRRYLRRGSDVLDAADERFPAAIPVSEDSQDILAYLDQPIESRKPVGYQRELLTAYRPNDTYYLPEPLRRRLRTLGQPETPDGEPAPAGTFARAILGRLLIDLSWASSHMEGNTYTWLDTRALIEAGDAAEGKAAIETQMILNHKTAIEMLIDNADIVDFNRFTVLNLHSALAENLLSNPADEGRTRRHIVEIAKSVYRPPTVPAQIDEMFDVLLGKAAQIADPFEQSFFAMVHVPYLQPFADVNKRTSRLLANVPLLRANLCPLTFLDVPASAYSRAVLGVYELTRTEPLRDLYVWAYERSAQEYLAIKQNLGDPDPVRLAYREFIKDTVRGVVTTLPPDTLAWIDARLEQVRPEHRAPVRTHVIDDLRRLHEGVLVRYGLRLADYQRWRERRQASL